MKIKFLLSITVSLFLMLQSFLFSATTKTQQVNITFGEIAVLADTGNPAGLVIFPPALAGNLPANISEQSTYLQYSSTVIAGQSRTITAQINTLPTIGGYTLNLSVASINLVTGKGVLGTIQTPVSLSTTAKTILTNIQNCTTGITPTSGANLLYQTNITSMPMQGTDSFVVTFTLTSAV
jgi:hypothetical protein